MLAEQGTINGVLLQIGIISEPIQIANTRAATVIGFVHFFVMLLTLTIYANLKQLSPNYRKAAADLGASPLQSFIHIILPLTLPGIMVGAFLTFVLAIGDYITPQILGGNNELPHAATHHAADRPARRFLERLGTLYHSDDCRHDRVSRLRPLAESGEGVMARSISTAYAALIYGFIFLPVAVLILFSFQGTLFPIPPFNGPSLRWYGAVLGDARLVAGLVNSFLVAIISSAIATLIGFLAAWGFARFHLPASALLRGLIALPLTVSYLIIGMGLLIFFNWLGLPKSLVAAGIGHVVINLPLCFAIIYSQMSDHQANIERAARDLGAKEWQVLALVTAPMLWPAIFAAFFLSMTFSWDEFVIAYLLTRFDTTLPVEIWALLRSGLNPKTNAVGSLVFGVSIVLAVVFEFVALRRRPQ